MDQKLQSCCRFGSALTQVRLVLRMVNRNEEQRLNPASEPRRKYMPIETYQNVIIGSGEGGKYLAWHLAQSGQKTAVVERRWIGGSCPNINCLPSKNEIWSAKVARYVDRPLVPAPFFLLHPV